MSVALHRVPAAEPKQNKPEPVPVSTGPTRPESECPAGERFDRYGLYIWIGGMIILAIVQVAQVMPYLYR